MVVVVVISNCCMEPMILSCEIITIAVIWSEIYFI